MHVAHITFLSRCSLFWDHRDIQSDGDTPVKFADLRQVLSLKHLVGYLNRPLPHPESTPHRLLPATRKQRDRQAVEHSSLARGRGLDLVVPSAPIDKIHFLLIAARDHLRDRSPTCGQDWARRKCVGNYGTYDRERQSSRIVIP
jgi:hypothetical protein